MYFINLVILYKIINCMTRTNIFKVFRLRNYSILDEMVHPRFISYMIDFIMVRKNMNHPSSEIRWCKNMRYLGPVWQGFTLLVKPFYLASTPRTVSPVELKRFW